MIAYVFPGQGSQFPGMGKELYESDSIAQILFEKANDILGYRITDIMFDGDEEDLKATEVTQPAVFIHSVVLAVCKGVKPDMVAGHSLGEFSALVAARSLELEPALRLVSVRAHAMQRCCVKCPGTMAAIIAGDAAVIEEVCQQTPGIVIAANYNCDSQIVISGEVEAVKEACARIKERGARRTLPLKVGGAFHSPLMEPARAELAEAIEATKFYDATCPVYQNVDAIGHTDAEEIKQNLLMQLTSPVLWTQTVRNMVSGGADRFIEAGPGKVLQGLVSKIAPEVEVSGI